MMGRGRPIEGVEEGHSRQGGRARAKRQGRKELGLFKEGNRRPLQPEPRGARVAQNDVGDVDGDQVMQAVVAQDGRFGLQLK